MFSTEDLQQITSHGLTAERVAGQLKRFAEGFEYIPLAGSASVDRGIRRLDDAEVLSYQALWDAYLVEEHKVVKFVPASGAASRMFKDLFEFMNGDEAEPTSDYMKTFFDNIRRFPFYDQLNRACIQYDAAELLALIERGEYRTVVRRLLIAEGLNYGALPKGMLLFHRYAIGSRAAIEEHLAEGAEYAVTRSGVVRLHFTVSPEHLPLFKALLEARTEIYETHYGVKYHLSFSEQKPSTDTVAADMDNQAARDDQGRMMFRPGGHGALIENLNDIMADVVFVKNIDNVVPDRLREATNTYKKVIAGVLVEAQQKAFAYLEKIDAGDYTHEEVLEMLHFTQEVFCVKNPKVKDLEDCDLVLYIKEKLNRPIRVCGMVRNEGEAGGGPFLAYSTDGTIAPQILESVQVDLSDHAKRVMFEQGTHFNPVDLVCTMRNYKGERFDLTQYVDQEAGFISTKSKGGVTQKALELPGLWNGAMSDWNTIFVEVPIETFNPVKSVNDLLRPFHRAEE